MWSRPALSLTSLHVQTENFPRLAFRNHLEWPAADFAIDNEGLGTDTGIDRQLEALAAKGALDGFRYLHANPSQKCFTALCVFISALAGIPRSRGSRRCGRGGLWREHLLRD